MKVYNEPKIDLFRGRYSVKESSRGNVVVFLFVSILLAAAMLAAPVEAPAQVSVGVSVAFGPPALPVYVQPPWPGPGFIWVPGYRACGRRSPSRARSGPRAIGDGAAACLSGTKAIGDRWWASTEALTMASATPVTDTPAAIGAAAGSITTAR